MSEQKRTTVHRTCFVLVLTVAAVSLFSPPSFAQTPDPTLLPMATTAPC